jgi:lipopolysaccharide/colanic/teichoic acid biosynthesis glycosyltransferase
MVASVHTSHTVVLVIKSFFDKIIATAALIAFSPVLAFIALAIVLGDGGPALFTQTRVGKDGQPFTVLKFRTMVPDAEVRKEALLALNDGDGLLFKLRKDPRITTIGSWLRRTSLDELPQLINVMLGEMSLVGPRPALPVEAALYRGDVSRRLEVKPGMTGLWQISGRSDLSYEDAVRLDLRYVENWTLALDLQILWKTCAAVANRRGAY